MGLSSEERYQKFFRACLGWRSHLCDLHELVDADQRVSLYRNERSREVVKGWISDLDVLVGSISRRLGANSLYWFSGEDAQSLRNLLTDPFALERFRPEKDANLFDRKAEEFSLFWYSESYTYRMFAGALQGCAHKSYDGLNALGHWWDGQSFVNFFSYAVWRYDDDLFTKAEQQALNELFGSYVNQRFEVCFGACPDEERVGLVENILLSKFKILQNHVRDGIRNAKAGAAFTKPVDLDAFIAELRSMTGAQIYENDRKRSQQEFDRSTKNQPPEPIKLDGLFGYTPETAEAARPLAKVLKKAPKHKKRSR